MRAISLHAIPEPVAALGTSTAVFAHYRFGRFDRSKEVELTGVITRLEFVNPRKREAHSGKGRDRADAIAVR